MTKALIIIDLQNDYFPDGKFSLAGIEEVGAVAAKLLANFREKNLPIFHIQHIEKEDEAPFFAENTQGSDIHSSLQPNDGEVLIVKHNPNSFLDTELYEKLSALHIEQLVICGAMSHMCIDATVRAALDLDYECTVVHDACATRDLEFNGIQVPAAQVQAAMMAALEFAGADIVNSDAFLG